MFFPKNDISPFQLITNEWSRVSLLDQVRHACDAGCNWIQLRVKEQHTTLVHGIAEQAKRISDQYGAQLIINDYLDIALQIDADGVHLGRKDRSIGEARKVLGEKAIIGATANDSISAVEAVLAGANYLGIGPYRYTVTKRNLDPLLNIKGIYNIINVLNAKGFTVPVIAVGGIRPDDVESLLSVGVHGVAVSSAVWNAIDCKIAISTFLTCMEENEVNIVE